MCILYPNQKDTCHIILSICMLIYLLKILLVMILVPVLFRCTGPIWNDYACISRKYKLVYQYNHSHEVLIMIITIGQTVMRYQYIIKIIWKDIHYWDLIWSANTGWADHWRPCDHHVVSVFVQVSSCSDEHFRKAKKKTLCSKSVCIGICFVSVCLQYSRDHWSRQSMRDIGTGHSPYVPLRL